jgi:predicted PurR-regulated permease PerM
MSEVDGAIDETPTVPVTDDSGTAVVDQSQVDTADASSWRTFITKMNSKLEALQPRIQQLPGFEWARNKAKVYLQNDQNRSDLIALVLSKSGGLFTATTTFLGNIASFLLNFVLTIFFFSFFLQKIATYDAHGARRRSTGEYLVESIFKSRWLPETSPRALEEAQGIVNEIILKLQIWVKGYLWIIIIESAIYVTLFFILGVPYFAVLGMIAGLTILLPFIGPIASALLTITVFYAVAPPSVAIVLIIVLAYVIMNGVIEQLFLYPALVGEALGLNVLETIIVVLIGGLVAGLAGVIFAVPAASAMKFLIPKLYATWRPATSNPPPEEKRHHG